MLAIMKKLIFQELKHIDRLISYQDTEVHNGTIYKAAENKGAPMKHIATVILIAGVGMLSMLWAPVWQSVHLYEAAALNQAIAGIGSVALVSCLWLLGAVGGKYPRSRRVAFILAATIAGGSAWVIGAHLAASYSEGMAALLGPWWWPTAVLMAVLGDVAVVGSGWARSTIEAAAEHEENLDKKLDAASIALARAEKEVAALREQLKAAQVAAERRPSGRQTYAVRALEALQGAEGEWLTADELGERLGVEADRLRAPLAKLEAGGKVARMSSGAGERIYAAMIAGRVPDPPAHVLRFKAGEVSS